MVDQAIGHVIYTTNIDYHIDKTYIKLWYNEY